MYNASNTPVTKVTQDASLDDLDPIGHGGYDGISGRQYRALYRVHGCPFGVDENAIELTRKNRNAIRALAGLPPMYETIAELERAQRDNPMPKPMRVDKRRKRVTQVTLPKVKRIAPRISRKYRQRYSHVNVRDFVYLRDGGRCFYCFCDVPRNGAHFDHVYPASRGGKADYANLVLSCPACNSRKSASVLENLIDILAEVARRNRDFSG